MTAPVSAFRVLRRRTDCQDGPCLPVVTALEIKESTLLQTCKGTWGPCGFSSLEHGSHGRADSRFSWVGSEHGFGVASLESLLQGSPGHANLGVGCTFYAQGFYCSKETPKGVYFKKETPMGVYFKKETPMGVYFQKETPMNVLLDKIKNPGALRVFEKCPMVFGIVSHVI